MDPITFNVDPEDVEGQQLHVRYRRCIDKIRAQVTTTFHNFMILINQNVQPYFNVAVMSEFNATPISITMKVKKSDFYRKGLGEPQPNDQQNNEPWRHGVGYQGFIAGAQPAGFSVSYKTADIEDRHWLGPSSLRNALQNLFYGANVDVRRSAYMTIVIHLLEGARFSAISQYIEDAMATDQYADTDQFPSIHKSLIRNWGKISERVQQTLEEQQQKQPEHRLRDDEILIEVNNRLLKNRTLQEARASVAIPKQRRLNM